MFAGSGLNIAVLTIDKENNHNNKKLEQWQCFIVKQSKLIIFH